MTVAVAVRKNDSIVLAADSMVNFGGQRFPTDNCQFHKIVRLGETVMVWAGWSLYAELLTAYMAQRPPPSLFTEAEVFAFFVQFWRALGEEYTLRPGGPAENHPFADLDSTFLLANRARIFRVASDMDVTAFSQYTAIGSGSKYALGALRVLYDQLDDPAEIARRAIGVGVEFDVYCGGPIDIVEIPADPHEPVGPPEIHDFPGRTQRIGNGGAAPRPAVRGRPHAREPRAGPGGRAEE